MDNIIVATSFKDLKWKIYDYKNREIHITKEVQEQIKKFNKTQMEVLKYDLRKRNIKLIAM